jgi:hypothetical protein
MIIVEDADLDGWCWYPDNEGFAFFLQTYREALKRAGGDHALGRKLYACFLDAGFPHASVTLINPLHIADEGTPLAYSTRAATAAAILAEGLHSRSTGAELIAQRAAGGAVWLPGR